MQKNKNFKELLNEVKAFVFDVDGVLSSDTIPLHPTDGPMRTVNIKDGYALQLAVKKGYPIGIITGGDTESVQRRFQRLGIKDVYMKAPDKLPKLEDFMRIHNLSPENVLYMGDDIPDYRAMKIVGIPVCPIDAAPEIKEISIYISQKKGGEGCARDVLEQVLKVQGNWMNGNEAFGW